MLWHGGAARRPARGSPSVATLTAFAVDGVGQSAPNRRTERASGPLRRTEAAFVDVAGARSARGAPRRGMTDDPATLLLVEDDPLVRTFLADNLTADRYGVLLAEGLHDATRVLHHKRPDLAIVDLGLPDGSGLELVRRVREADGVASRLDPSLPIVILSGRASEHDRVRAFEQGVDDYVVKPFAYAELRLRIRAVLRRTRERRHRGRLRVGDLEIDPAGREARLRGRRVQLATKEYALLLALAAEPTRVFTKV